MTRRLSVSARRAWEDRYRTPSLPDLVRGMDAQARDLFQMMRQHLGALPGVREQLGWEGIPWRWSLSYHLPGTAAVFAYLVPQPAKPLLGLPLAAGVLETVLGGRLSKPVREAILLAPAVGSVRWTQWELASKTQIEELAALVRSAHGAALCVGAVGV